MTARPGGGRCGCRMRRRRGLLGAGHSTRAAPQGPSGANDHQRVAGSAAPVPVPFRRRSRKRRERGGTEGLDAQGVLGLDAAVHTASVVPAARRSGRVPRPRRARAGSAEAVGFEPTVGCPTHDFQSCRFGRSRTPPGLQPVRLTAPAPRVGRPRRPRADCVAPDPLPVGLTCLPACHPGAMLSLLLVHLPVIWEHGFGDPGNGV